MICVYEGDNELFNKIIEITSAIPCSLKNNYQSVENMNHISMYLLENRLDSMKIGFFTCSEENEIISREKLINYIEFQKVFPNSVIISFDIDLYNAHVFPFKVFRISEHLIDLVTRIEIEENLDAGHNKENDFYEEIFKTFTSSENMIENLEFSIKEKPQELFRTLVNKKDNKDYEDEDIQNTNFDENNNFKFSLNRKM